MQLLDKYVTIMRHNELKTKILKSILDLESFTVSELCALSGLERDQVYGELSKLQRDGVITSKTVQSSSSDKKQAAHRPLNLYQLVSDPTKRKQVIEQISPFLEAPIETQYIETDTAQKANRELNMIDLEIEKLQTGTHQYSSLWSEQKLAKVQVQIKELRERLSDVRDELELAIYESNTLVDASTTPDHPLIVDSKRWRQYSEKVEKLEYQTDNIVARRRAQQSFTQVLRQVVNGAKPSFAQVMKTFDSEIEASNNIELKRILSSEYEEFALSFSSDSSNQSQLLNQKLVEMAIRWSDDPELILKCIQKDKVDLKRKTSTTVDYNLVNAQALAGYRNEAFSNWIGWVKRHRHQGRFKAAGYEYPFYPSVSLMRTQSNTLVQHLSSLESIIEPNVNISAVSLDPFVSLELENEPLSSTLFNPSSGYSATVELADSLRRDQSDLFVYGSLERRMEFPGLPLIKLATILVSLGVEAVKAWEIAQQLNSETALVIVCSLQQLEKQFINRLKQIFGDSPLEEIDTGVRI